ncbi:MAG: acyl-ACP--UDP-N-acetylglucosamine O-acyltransferase [Planctomycetaceae bacterium]|nr:acyl-ACP--UDP-N-acetylglucosamine O-acyltransferase [Planctomycetaceae bacterium]
MAVHISPLAQVDSRAELGHGVSIGPFCVVGPHVRLGDGCRLDSHVVMVGATDIGDNNRFFPHCVIGAEPQDYSYTGAPTRVEIGSDNTFREGVTVNRGAEKEDRVTRIGNRNLLMANCHVAHNCHVYDQVVLVNGVLLGGHVHVHDGAIVSGNAVVHHFATLGTLSFVSGGCRVPNDIAPYMLAAGSDNPRILSVNVVGMQRRGISAATIAVIRQAHRLLYREHKKLEEARQILSAERADCIPIELMRLLDFIERQQQGRQGRQGEARRNQPADPGAEIQERRRAA